MLKPEDKKTFRSVAEVVFAMGRGNSLRISPEDLLDELNQAIPTVLDHELGKDLREAKTQLEVHISEVEIQEEIDRQTAKLTAVRSKAKQPFELIGLARKIQRSVDG